MTPGFIPTRIGVREDCAAARHRLSADLDRVYALREAALRRARACGFPGIGPATRPDLHDDDAGRLDSFMAAEIAAQALPLAA